MPHPNGINRASQWVNILAGVAGIAAFLMAGLAVYVSSQIQHLAQRAETNRTANEKTADQAREVQTAEQVRNNLIEKNVAELKGRVDMFHDLYIAGKLRLE